MKRWIASIVGLSFLLCSSLSFSQGAKSYSQAELDRMLAPIALYPDPLLSQILMASTYPLEVVEAARWSRANPGLRGADAARAVEGEDWDPSVKSLAAFPQVLQRMDENLEWTRSLGDAFLAQQPHVMETIQQLRQRAHAAGHLRSSDQLQVQQQGQAIHIQPVNPQVVYVPYYDPLVVYGPWWWPAYRPVAWAPWPGYVRPGLSVSFWWGAPIVVRRTVFVDHVHWRHDPHHRRGAEYRDPAVRQQFVANTQAREERREARREERRQQRPTARDLHDSKVLSPQAKPAAPRPQAQVQPRPPQQVQERPRHVQQEERRHARAERREQRHEARQERRHEARQERGGGKGG